MLCSLIQQSHPGHLLHPPTSNSDLNPDNIASRVSLNLCISLHLHSYPSLSLGLLQLPIKGLTILYSSADTFPPSPPPHSNESAFF